MKMRNKKEILEYEGEAFDRVWLNRRYNHIHMMEEGDASSYTPEFEQGAKKAQDRIIEEYGLYNDEGDLNDWEYGFWSGVLATLRWVLGEESKTMLDT